MVVSSSWPNAWTPTTAEQELIQGLPFLDIHLVRQDGRDELVGTVFGTDRHFDPKGMIEIVSWN